MRFTPIDKTCQRCGTVFRVTQKVNAERKYCSSACYHAYEAEHGGHGVVPRIEFKCAKCGTPFFFEPGQLRAYRNAHGQDPKYCSRACGWEGKRKLIGQPCVVCGKPVPVEWRPSADGKRTPRTAGRRNKICSPECRSKFKLAEWEKIKPFAEREITKRVMKNGYVMLRVPIEGGGSRGVSEHRYVVEQDIGRELLPEETVHHINNQKTDNRRENLELFTSRHGPGARVRDQVQWAITLLTDYPDFAAKAGVRLIKTGAG
jgi:hypothetical protein